jgi:hypothetical protein
MGPEQANFVQLIMTLNSQLQQNARVLEIGSYDVNGSIRSLFSGVREYIGLDILSYRLNEYDNTDKSFILYIRTEDLEELRNSKLNNLGI